MKILKKLLLLSILLFIALTLFAFGYYFAVTREVALSPEKLLFSERNVTVYDYQGESVIGASNSFFKQTTSIRDIPPHVKQAFVDIEDKRFYRHGGYDIKRILRATLNNLRAKSFKEGASTISQQLIKNTHLSQEKTVKRKLREWKLTRALERNFSKDEILERYLNTIYFGHSCFGITSAAEFYFGKIPSELSLSDAAILAGLVKSPNHYSPFKNPEGCAKRKAVVLTVMHRNGSISATQKQEALQASLPTSPTDRKQSGYMYFVFDELSSLAEKHGFKLGGKIEISTYLDKALQQEVESIANGYVQSDKALFVLDGNTHGFKACVSTVGNIPRLPGSLIKPLLVYAPALEEDILSPATPILDCKIDYNGYSPENYDGEYHGYVSARECVEKSLNIPAVKTLESLTLRKGIRYLEKLNLPVNKEDESLALALGGMKTGYSLKDVLAAYSTFQNRGNFYPCGFISSVRVNDIPVYTKTKRTTKVFSEESSYLMTDILKSTAKCGTAKKLRTLPFEIAAKTGTVGTKAGNTDAYALSYTTRDCAAVWIGNADNTLIDCTGGGTPCNLLYQINEALSRRYQTQESTISPFSPCQNVQRVELDKDSYYDTHTICLADELSPATHRISEMFKKSVIPLNKSTSYSNPKILAPQVELNNSRVVITFNERCPRYYRYKIDRYDYVTHTTIYDGEYLPQFLDDTLQKNKNYVYTVTPYYKERFGESIVLPAVSTMENNFKEHEKPIPKEWWKY